MLILKRMIWTALVSMIPAIEVKGAIPFGQAVGLHPVVAYVSAIIGSTIILTFLAYFTRWFYSACKRKGYLKRFIGWMDKITNKNLPKWKKFGHWAIVAYVAVPIPGTGTWTGAIIASVLGMSPRKIIFSVFLGNLISALILSFFSNGVLTTFFK
ncbi:MAG: COG2426 family protein [Lachnospiraceae bacterium]